MENSLITVFLNNLPGIATGVITGIIILVIEYKTGWFIKNKREHSGNLGANFPNSIPRNPSNPTNRVYRVSNWNWIDLSFQIIIFVLIFAMVFLVIGMPISIALSGKTSTILDNSENPNIVVKNIGAGDTKTFFDNTFFITLIDVVNDGEVSFTIGQIGSPSQLVENSRNGTTVLYSANGITYDVRVTSISWLPMFGKDSADFTVTKMP